MTAAPESLLTVERPHLWRAAVGLAECLTGYTFPAKRPAADGTIYACWGGTSEPLTKEEQIENLKRRVAFWKDRIKNGGGGTPATGDDLFRYRDELDRCQKRLRDLDPEIKTSSVEVPDGAMEWLLHEVGHWVAATPAERLLPNYGVGPSEVGSDGERELQAWAFEEIVLAPFGHARDFAPPSQRDGAAFAKAGPLPEHAMRHVERQIAALGLDVEQWRAVWGEWVGWGIDKGHRAPWKSAN